MVAEVEEAAAEAFNAVASDIKHFAVAVEALVIFYRFGHGDGIFPDAAKAGAVGAFEVEGAGRGDSGPFVFAREAEGSTFEVWLFAKNVNWFHYLNLAQYLSGHFMKWRSLSNQVMRITVVPPLRVMALT